MKYLMITITIILSGCFADTGSPDSRFSGNYVYYDREVASDGINETTVYSSYRFDDSDQVWKYYSYKSYSSSTGWTIFDSGDYYTWSVTATTICLSGRSCENYEFIGQDLLIGDRLHIKK